MKFVRFLLCVPLFFLGGTALSQTLNWGNEVFGEITDSNGVEVDNTYFFELGAFFNGVNPEVDDISLWLENWQVFDSTTYDTVEDRMQGTVDLRDDSTRTGVPRDGGGNPTQSTASFEGLEAYIWIRKGDQPVAGSEWLLVRADDWVFPAIDECCGRGLFEFSTASDLTASNVPLWGRQYSYQGETDVIGPGEYTSDGGSSTLQTYTFPIPEPSGTMLVLISTLGMLTRRNRMTR